MLSRAHSTAAERDVPGPMTEAVRAGGPAAVVEPRSSSGLSESTLMHAVFVKGNNNGNV